MLWHIWKSLPRRFLGMLLLYYHKSAAIMVISMILITRQAGLRGEDEFGSIRRLPPCLFWGTWCFQVKRNRFGIYLLYRGPHAFIWAFISACLSSSDNIFGLQVHHHRQRLENEISHLGAQGSGSPRPGQGGQVQWEGEMIAWLMKSNW